MKPKKINIGGSAPKHDQIGGGDKPASQQTVDAEAANA
jgi:hypothetical protein